jgi:hypothetical protein
VRIRAAGGSPAQLFRAHIGKSCAAKRLLRSLDAGAHGRQGAPLERLFRGADQDSRPAAQEHAALRRAGAVEDNRST